MENKLSDLSGTTGTRTANYISVEPNSHFWTDLNQLLVHLNNISVTGNQFYPNIFKEELKYIVIGLENTIKNGYNLKNLKGNNIGDLVPYYESIEEMIADVERYTDIYTSDYSSGNIFLVDFSELIEHTIGLGFNLTNGRKMERKEIYNRIDGERDYQDKTWVARRTANDTPDEEISVAEWINYIEHHTEKAKNAVYFLNKQEALAEVRKIAALAVRAMEIHGCPERVTTPPHTGKCDCNDCDCNK